MSLGDLYLTARGLGLIPIRCDQSIAGSGSWFVVSMSEELNGDV
jgi:hypothetical protein